jgi:riboflavin kinase, archaea type
VIKVSILYKFKPSDSRQLLEKYMITLRGKIAAGFGEGQYYISREGYRNQLVQKLGIDPFPGTLNLVIHEPLELHEIEAVKIEGFIDENRTFGECTCFPARIADIKCAIVRPERTSYPLNLIEIIAPVNLRNALKVSDGDEVIVALE